MTRSTPGSAPIPFVRDRRNGLPRECSFRLTDGSPALVRERLDTFAVAFLADARPGLIFEYSRLVFANDASRNLLGSTSASDAFVEALRKGVMEPDLLKREPDLFPEGLFDLPLESHLRSTGGPRS